MTPHPHQRRRDAVHSRRWLILAVLCLSLLMVVIDNTIVNVALPTLSTELDASTTELQWIVDAYTLVFAALLLAFGHFGDRFGRKLALQLGLVIFAVTSAAGRHGDHVDPAHRGARAHGHRRGVRLPGHAGDPGQRLHRPQGARSRHRHLVGVHGRRGRARPGHRRLPARALRVGLDLPREPAARRARDRRRLVPRPDLARSARRRHGPPRACCCRPPASPCVVWAIIEAPHRGWTDSLVVDRRRRRASLLLAGLRAVGAPRPAPAARRRPVPQRAVHRREPVRHRGVLRAVRLHLPHHAVPAAGAGLLAPRGGPAHPARSRSPRASRRRSPSSPCTAGGRSWSWPSGLAVMSLGFVLASTVEVDTPYVGLTVISMVTDRDRAGPDDRPGHRVDHGRPARGEGRSGLGGQRHDP